MFLAFVPSGYGIIPGPLGDPGILEIAVRIGKTPVQVWLSWAIQRGTTLLTTPRAAVRAKENFDVSLLPEDAFDEINLIQIRQRFNGVVKTGISVSFQKVIDCLFQLLPSVLRLLKINWSRLAFPGPSISKVNKVYLN